MAARLRAAGAVLLAKTNLSEWANIRSTRSSSGWSGRGGQCRNPYVLDRNPCGSSSGSGAATAANLAAVAIGTETDGSIVCPANNCGLVGLKPTVGLVSRAGIIPISAHPGHRGTHDPHRRRRGRPARRLAGARSARSGHRSLRRALAGRLHGDSSTPRGFCGARIGVARQYFGFHSEVDRVMQAALDDLQRLGAVLVDPVKLPADADYGENELDGAALRVQGRPGSLPRHPRSRRAGAHAGRCHRASTRTSPIARCPTSGRNSSCGRRR